MTMLRKLSNQFLRYAVHKRLIRLQKPPSDCTPQRTGGTSITTVYYEGQNKEETYSPSHSPLWPLHTCLMVQLIQGHIADMALGRKTQGGEAIMVFNIDASDNGASIFNTRR